jgi:hypothetical protein
MTVIASGITFRVKLDVEGAKADLERTEQETAKTERAARTRQERASSSPGTLAALGGMARTGAAVTAGALGIDYIFEQLAPRIMSFVEEMAKGTVAEEFTKIMRRKAEDLSKTAADVRTAISSPFVGAKRTGDILADTALLGGRAPGYQEMSDLMREQRLLYAVQERAEQVRRMIRGELTAKGYERAAGAVVNESLRYAASLW